MVDRKLVYIMNHYSEESASHFYHILNLLNSISLEGVFVYLVIEKASSNPNFDINSNIEVIVQKRSFLFRPLELAFILFKLRLKGAKKTFVRISQNAAVPAIIVSRIFGGEVYYWHSGTTYSLRRKFSFDIDYFKNFFVSELPFLFVKTFVNYFVTGPEYMVEYYANVVGVKRSKLVCLYNDIDLSRFKNVSLPDREGLRVELGIENSVFVVLFVHRLSPVRRSLFYMPYVLKDFLLSHPNSICYVIGGGSEVPELRKMLFEFNLEEKVVIVGEKPNAVIHKYYQASDLFVNPTFTEGFPRVLLEAMASGLPIVTTNAGGIKDILGPLQLEYMVDVLDRDGFSAKLVELGHNEKTRFYLSKENINHVSRFSTRNVAKMYVNKIFR